MVTVSAVTETYGSTRDHDFYYLPWLYRGITAKDSPIFFVARGLGNGRRRRRRGGVGLLLCTEVTSAYACENRSFARIIRVLARVFVDLCFVGKAWVGLRQLTFLEKLERNRERNEGMCNFSLACLLGLVGDGFCVVVVLLLLPGMAVNRRSSASCVVLY